MARHLHLASFGLLVVCLLCAADAAPASAAPANDAFKDAQTVRIGATVRGTVNGATKQRGEPRHGRSLAKHSVWYRYAAARKVAVGLNTCRSNFDTVVAVYSGQRLGSLREVEFNNNGGCGEGGSRVIFTARPGRVYRIAVAGFAPRGRFRLAVRSINTPPNDDFVDAARIPLGSTVSGTLVNSTRELDEPIFQGETGTVWFRLRVSQLTTVQVSACSSSPTPYLAVYTGPSVSRLDRIVGAGECAERFTARADITYRIQATMEPELQAGFRISARAAQ
jgi:hypothetical protein